MFTRALDALDVNAGRALMVGDTPGNDGGADPDAVLRLVGIG